MKSQNQGFTLIEVMLVIAILTLLMAIAIPLYQNYTIRARLAEVFNVASGLKTRVVKSYSLGKGCPTNGSGEQGTLPPSAYRTGVIDNITVTNVAQGCDIVALIRNDAPVVSAVKGQTVTLQLSAATTSGSFFWDCISSLPSSDVARYLSSVFR